MRTRLLLLAPIVLAAAAVVGASARAETIDVRATALGWQAEHARVVVRARLVSHAAAGEHARRGRFSVVETLKGDAQAGSELDVVMHDGGHGFPWKPGRDHLLFVSLATPEGDDFRSVSGSFGVRLLPAKGQGPELEFPRIVARHLAAFDEDGTLARPDDLRSLLVELIGHADPGIAGSAALDFARHRSLHAGLTPAQRLAVLQAYRTHPSGKSSKHALAAALAHARPPGALAALVESVAVPEGLPLRGSVADALVVLDDPGTTKAITARLEGADRAILEGLLVLLGTAGDRTAAPVAQRYLAHEDARVRAQAAHALGLIARTVRDARRKAREEQPDLELEPLAGRGDLTALVIRARTKNEWRAGTWALAQLDQAEAYAKLRELAKGDPRPDVRRYAERYLKRPRISLVLR